MSTNILFVFEGEKTEKQITNNLTQFFINENTLVQCAYCADIYQLYKQIEDDEDLDTFQLLKERGQNSTLLAEYKRDDFAEIYLFFDYDGHATLADDQKVAQVLGFFNNETTAGKLYISYPMVEALKHNPDTTLFKDLKVKAKENIGYKQLVNNETQAVLKQITQYNKTIWLDLIALHLKKMNHIVHDSYALPSLVINQHNIFLKQLEKFIQVDETVAVLSSFPIFLFDYYGCKSMNDLIADHIANPSP